MADEPVSGIRHDGWLPTQQANYFSLALNSSEFLLAFGLSRLSMMPSAMGDTSQSHIEWVAALSISPTAAAQLSQILEINLREYEEKFGKIPQDPNFKLTQTR